MNDCGIALIHLGMLMTSYWLVAGCFIALRMMMESSCRISSLVEADDIVSMSSFSCMCLFNNGMNTLEFSFNSVRNTLSIVIKTLNYLK